MNTDARAFWLVEPGRGEIRPVSLPEPNADEVLVRTLWSGISRGTETLVWRGGVPERERETMAAPFQEGSFPGPVKYGYLSVGVVERGPAALEGRTVFCLHPHQTKYVVAASSVLPVPDDVSTRRAVLAGSVETAINIGWDAAPRDGDQVVVVGAGMVGCCTALELSRLSGVGVTLVDTLPDRAGIASALGIDFALPDDAPLNVDLVVHTSATSAGLTRSLQLLRPEGTVIEASWYGDTPVTLPLGEAFHSGRLTIRSSQVGTVAPAARSTHTHRDRLALALDRLADPAYDALLTGVSRFDDLPATMAALASGSLDALCHTISYEGIHEETN